MEPSQEPEMVLTEEGVPERGLHEGRPTGRPSGPHGRDTKPVVEPEVATLRVQGTRRTLIERQTFAAALAPQIGS